MGRTGSVAIERAVEQGRLAVALPQGPPVPPRAVAEEGAVHYRTQGVAVGHSPTCGRGRIAAEGAVADDAGCKFLHADENCTILNATHRELKNALLAS